VSMAGLTASAGGTGSCGDCFRRRRGCGPPRGQAADGSRSGTLGRRVARADVGRVRAAAPARSPAQAAWQSARGSPAGEAATVGARTLARRGGAGWCSPHGGTRWSSTAAAGASPGRRACCGWSCRRRRRAVWRCSVPRRAGVNAGAVGSRRGPRAMRAEGVVRGGGCDRRGPPRGARADRPEQAGGCGVPWVRRVARQWDRTWWEKSVETGPTLTPASVRPVRPAGRLGGAVTCTVRQSTASLGGPRGPG
jgi:hypothetical protein